ncbi:uncharacterized protein [Watersipora subatra]|uniref:uncharacterized protein n=1 Tax=Watersipora subatra TaxID=2589382 RepID=UPI00355B5E04
MILQDSSSPLSVNIVSSNDITAVYEDGSRETLLSDTQQAIDVPSCWTNVSIDLLSVLQFFQSEFLPDAVYVLFPTNIWRLNLTDCTFEMVCQYPSGFFAKQMQQSCQNKSMVEVLSMDYSEYLLINVNSGKIIDRVLAPEFSDKNLFLLNSPDCTRHLEVAFPVDNTYQQELIWVNSTLVQLDLNTGILRNYRNMSSEITLIDSMTGAIWLGSIGILRRGLDGFLIGAELGTHTIMILKSDLPLAQARFHVAISEKQAARCLGSASDVHFNQISLDSCGYRCTHNKGCADGYSYDYSKEEYPGCPLHEVQHRELATYSQANTDSYLWQDFLPELAEFTYCFWFTGHKRVLSESPQIFSFSIKGDIDHYVVGYEYNAWDLQLYRGLRGNLLSPLTTEEQYIWDEEHRHCFTWQKYKLKWYADFQYPGKMELYFEFSINYPYKPIYDGSAFIPLHDQDWYATASWNTNTQMMLGNIADMNMWDYVMSDAAIATLSCYARGNVVSNATIKVHGTMTTTTPTYQCLGENRGSKTLVINTVVYLPHHVRLVLVSQHPVNSSKLIAVTSEDTVIELDIEGRCETLIGGSQTLQEFCPVKNNCTLNNQTMPGIIQLFYHQFNDFDKFIILVDNGYFTFRYDTCYLDFHGLFVESSSPRYIYRNCSRLAIVHIVDNYNMNITALTIQIKNDIYKRTEDVPTFLGRYRLPTSNVDCSLFWTVSVSASIDDMLNFAAINSKLVYLNTTSGTLSWYTNDEAMDIRHADTNVLLDKRIDLIAETSGDQLIASSYEMHAVLFLFEQEDLNSILHTSFRVTSDASMCSLTSLQPTTDAKNLESCMYKCAKDDYCVAFSHRFDFTCGIYYNNTAGSLIGIQTQFDCYVKSANEN